MFRIPFIRFSLLVCTFLFLHQAQAQFAVERAFPNISFSVPVDIQDPGDGSGRLFVAELKTGRVIVFQDDENVSQTEVFLDIGDKVRTSNGEEGLLGLAFDPNYESNGYFYVKYSASSPRRSVIERYTASPPSSNTADPESGLVIMQVTQPYGNHNGGQLAFGPDDGYLYIALGDGGSGGDPDENGEDRQTLLGSILRIDVSQASPAAPYIIPSDNPFVGNSSGYREEIYAYGLRNPWRFSFDPPTSRLWTGDVGQGSREEVDIIESGKNYGWNTMEGTLCHDPFSNCPMDNRELPVWEYGRSEGRSITGGYVYRGTRVPELVGQYIYADFETGRIWALEYDGSEATGNEEINDVSFGITSFGINATNDLFMAAFEGQLYRFEETASTGTDTELPTQAAALYTNFPNPVSASTQIPFSLNQTAQVEIKIFDMLGRETDRLVNATLQAGPHQVEWTLSRENAPGVYYYSLVVDGSVVDTKGLLVVK